MIRTRSNTTRTARSLTVTLAIAFLILSGAILLVNGAIASYANIQLEQDVIRVQQVLIARNASLEVSGFFEEKYQTLEAATNIVYLPQGTSDQRKLILESILATQPSFRQLVLLDAAGEQAAQVSRVSLEISNQFITQLEQVISGQLQPQQRYNSEIYYDEITNEPLIILVIPIDIWGFRGALAAEVNLQFMWTLVDQLKVGQTGYAYIVDNRGNLISFKDTKRVLLGENVSQISKVNEFISNPSNSTDVTPEINTYPGLLGEKVVGTYVPLNTPHWAVVTELPYTEAYAPVFQALTTILVAFLVTSILAGLAGVIFARRLAVPLVNLTSTATRIADGDIQLEAEVGGASEFVTLATAFNTMTEQLRNLISNLEQRVQERTNALEKRTLQEQAVARVARAIASVQDLDTLLPEITKLVSKQFDFYHVGIFLIDETEENAVLQAANSLGGRRMLERRHKLALDAKSIVGYSISRGEPRVALDVGSDAVYFDNPDLPDTRSEMALPLRIGKHVIGALDVQSTQQNAFSEENIPTLTTLADQVTIAIENARLFSESRSALEETETTFERYVKGEWSRFAQQAKNTGYLFDGKRTSPLDGKDDLKKVKSLPQTGRLPLEKDSRELVIPIRLRGQTIGFFEVKPKNKDRKWTQDDLTLLEAAAERAALALENARLVDTAQRRASRERTIGEISTKIGAVSETEAIMQAAVEELGRRIGGTAEVILEIETENGKS